jgi:putative transcriptional regulator
MRAREDARDRYGVARLRRRLGLGLAQVQFAGRYRIPLSTLRQWEQGVGEPDAASKLLLAVIAAEPELVARVAASSTQEASTAVAG